MGKVVVGSQRDVGAWMKIGLFCLLCLTWMAVTTSWAQAKKGVQKSEPASQAKTPNPPVVALQEVPIPTPVKEEYRVGERDVLEIRIFGQNPTDQQQPALYTVSASGAIRFPYIGDVLVIGKTVNEIHDVLVKKLSDGYIVDPQLSVGIKEYNSQSVSVIGEIARPGKIPLRGSTTLLEALSEAGLTKTTGGLATIARFEGGKNKVINIKLDDMFSGNFDQANIALRDGDIINVTRAEGSRFYVQGEVGKPGPYELDRGMTVLKAIAVAGGFTKFASKKVLIKSAKEGGGDHEVDVGKIERGKIPDVAVSGGDIIVVPKRFL
jgi:polysaccharide export outer membrane protein